MSINLKSILTSGLISGLIINVSAIAMVPMVGDEMDTVLASRGLPPLSNLAMAFFCCVSFIFGISLVGIYAVVKTQLGPGIKTAVIVALGLWFFAYFLANVSMVFYGFMPIRLTVIGTVWGLVELLVAGIIGTRLYKEVSIAN